MSPDLEGRKALMIEYLNMKVAEQDWHGVADAAMDLRDIEAEHLGRLWTRDRSDT